MAVCSPAPCLGKMANVDYDDVNMDQEMELLSDEELERYVTIRAQLNTIDNTRLECNIIVPIPSVSFFWRFDTVTLATTRYIAQLALLSS